MLNSSEIHLHRCVGIGHGRVHNMSFDPHAEVGVPVNGNRKKNT